MTRSIILWAVFAALFVMGSALGAPSEGRGPAPWKPGRTPTMAGSGGAARDRSEIPSTVGVVHGPVRLGSAVYPEPSLPLKFNHGQHLRQGMTCQQCHTSIDTSRSVSDNNLPTGAVCDACHGEQHTHPRQASAQCEMCHTRVDEAGERVIETTRLPKPLLHFNHAMHAQAGAACGDCHRAMTAVRLATTAQLPTEAQCLECHDGKTATQRCGACHPTDRTGRLRTRAIDDRAMPTLVPRGDSAWGMVHDLAFVEDHAAVARTSGNSCNSCHDEAFCSDCHAGVMRPLRLHPADFITTHALQARGQTQSCQSCHQMQSFCLGCHERTNVTQSSDLFNVGGGARFHPDDWSGPIGAPQRHAHAAQRNMASCASCHAEDTCLACHATTQASTPGWGVSPHGPGFAGSARCTALERRNRRVCLRCHAPGTPALSCLGSF